MVPRTIGRASCSTTTIVAKYYSLTEHLIVPEMLVFSRKTWDGLSKDDQALVLKFGREAQFEERALWTKYEKEALDKAKGAGIQVIEMPTRRRSRTR